LGIGRYQQINRFDGKKLEAEIWDAIEDALSRRVLA